jgi:transketolase
MNTMNPFSRDPAIDWKPLAGSELAEASQWLRISAMTMTHHAGIGHTGGDLSAADILAALYLGGILQVRPDQPSWSERDRFIMSKGHCSGVFYSTLAARGFFPASTLKTYMDAMSKLNGHPDRNKTPGVEANTGPLGHGLPIAVGAALAARMSQKAWRTYVLTGDGELQEGSNWEAAMTAQHYGLDNLVVIVDRNRIQQGDFTESTIRMDPMADKWRAFGFHTLEVDGHKHDALLQAFAEAASTKGRPTCIVANTLKGKGVSFAEDKPAWHHGVPTKEQLKAAAAELGVDVPWWT